MTSAQKRKAVLKKHPDAWNNISSGRLGVWSSHDHEGPNTMLWLGYDWSAAYAELFPLLVMSNDDLLVCMKKAQTELWDFSLELEKRLGFAIDTTQDLQDIDLAELIAIHS